MIKRFVLLFCILEITLARSAGSNTNDIDEGSSKPISHHSRASGSSGVSSYMNDLKSMYKTYQDCAKDDISSCLKLKLISSMDNAFRSLRNVELFKGVTFEKDPNAETVEKPIQMEDIESNLPRSLSEKDSILNGIIAKELVSFLNSHTLKVILVIYLYNKKYKYFIENFLD